MLAFLIFIFVVVQVLTWMYYRNKIGDRAFEMYDDWVQIDQDDRARLWGIIEGSNKRRKRVEKALRKERARHTRTAEDSIALLQERDELQALLNGLELEVTEERSRYRALAADTIDELVKKQTKANVVKGLMRKIKENDEEE